MYHCGTDPVLHHIANGMFGMVIVEPEGGLPPMENEFFIVQHEWYLGPQGEVSSYAKANQAAPAPDFVMFNGAAFQYKDNPIQIPTGEEVRLFVLDVGPSIDSSFHIVGTIFDNVIKEGIHLERGNDGNWGSQAVDLAPAQGAVIELKAAEDGLYPMVTHAFQLPRPWSRRPAAGRRRRTLILARTIRRERVRPRPGTARVGDRVMQPVGDVVVGVAHRRRERVDGVRRRGARRWCSAR